MIWLAIDTSTAWFSAALYSEDVIMAEYTISLGKTMLQRTALLLERLVSDCGIEMDSLEGLAVGIGPGSYTGLRVGLGVMHGLALARELPLIGVETSMVLAADIPAQSRVMVAQDSGRRTDQVAFSVYSTEVFPPEELSAPCLVAIESVVKQAGKEGILVGSAATRIMEQAGIQSRLPTERIATITSIPRASLLAMIADYRFRNGAAIDGKGDPSLVDGIYLTIPPIPEKKATMP